MFRFITLWACLVAGTFAQESTTTGKNSPGEVASATTSTVASAPTHTIDVGDPKYKITPRQTTAQVGDIIEWRFWSGEHQIVRGDLDHPCTPYEEIHHSDGGFSSGKHKVADGSKNPTTFQVRVNNTDPIFFYSSVENDCSKRMMMGVINPTTDQNLILWSRAVDISTSSCSNNDTMKPGQIAGIVVASVGGLVIAAILGFYLRGNRQARLARKAAATTSSSSHHPDRPRKGSRNQAPSSLYSLEAVPPLRPPRAPFTESGWLEASSKETLALPSTPQAPPSTPVSPPQGCMKKKKSSSSSTKKPLRKSQYATRQLPPLPYELNTETSKPSSEWPRVMKDSPGAATFVSYPTPGGSPYPGMEDIPVSAELPASPRRVEFVSGFNEMRPKPLTPNPMTPRSRDKESWTEENMGSPRPPHMQR